MVNGTGAETPRCVLDARAGLGEGPVWCDRRQLLFWVDITNSELHSFQPETGIDRTFPMPARIGSLALTTGDDVLVALQGGVSRFDADTGRLVPFVAVEASRPSFRLNDGRCDRQGRFWVGAMDTREAREPGAFWRVDTDTSVHQLIEGVSIPNGLAWSPDGETMYWSDSPTRTIWSAPYDVESGCPRQASVFARLPEGSGVPDGATMDRDGGLWVAIYDGARVIRLARDGSISHEVRIAADKTACCAFGGPELRALYVTTGRNRVADDRLATTPRAGGIFAARAPFQGLPEPRFPLA